MNIGDLKPVDYPQMNPSSACRNFTLTEQLESKKADLEARLKEVNDALDALKKQPGLEELLNMIARVRY